MKQLALILLFVLAMSSIRSQSLIELQNVDTTYYETGKIKSIVFNNNVLHTQFVLSKLGGSLVKIIYQYDECNQLRNTTYIYTIYTDLNSYGILNPSKYYAEDHMVENVNCDKVWLKPFTFY